MNGSFASGSSSGVSAATSAAVRSGEGMTGPEPRTTSKSTPIAGSGVRMSENMITPSTPYWRHGCSESSVAISGVSERLRNSTVVEYSRKACIYRPAWRISHTGVRSTASPRAARSRMSCSAVAGGLGALRSSSAVSDLAMATAWACGARGVTPARPTAGTAEKAWGTSADARSSSAASVRVDMTMV